MEQENEECFSFLDILVKRSSIGHLLSEVYRKPTQFKDLSTLDQNVLHNNQWCSSSFERIVETIAWPH